MPDEASLLRLFIPSPDVSVEASPADAKEKPAVAENV